VSASPLTAQAVAELVGGRLRGAGDVVLTRVAALDRAGADALSFLSSTKYVEQFRRSQAGAVLMAEPFSDTDGGPATRIIVPDPTDAIMTVATHFTPDTSAVPGIAPSAVLAEGVRLGAEVTIGPYAVLGHGVRLGDRCRIGAGSVLEDEVQVGEASVLEARVVCYRGTVIGRRVVVQAGTVLGGVGFGFVSSAVGHRRVPHVGRCILEDDVEVGSNCCIDRGSIDDTVIGSGTKIDNLVQVGHNVRMGKRCFVAAGVGIGGSSRIGDDVVLAGQAGIAGHLTVGDRARVAAQGGVSTSVPAEADYGGSPARPHRDTMRAQASAFRVARIIKDLEAMVEERHQRG